MTESQLTKVNRTPDVTPSPKEMADRICRRIVADKATHVVLGPIVLDERGYPYFFCAVGRVDNEGRTYSVTSDTHRKAEALRRLIAFSIVLHCPPVVIHDFDNEIEMARFGAAIWPTKFVRREDMARG